MKKKTSSFQRQITAPIFLLLFSFLVISCDSIDRSDRQGAEKMRGSETVHVGQKEERSIPGLFVRTGELSKKDEWYKTIEVVDRIEQRIKSDPDDAKSKLRLCEIYMNEARITGEHGYYYPSIISILDGVSAQQDLEEEEKFRALSLKSSVLLSQHRFKEAITLAEKAVEMRPHNAQIYGALVDAHVELGEYDEAVKMATKMMDLRPDLLSYSRASYLREIHGDPDGAIEAMDLAVSSGIPGNENMAWTRLTLGNLYEANGDLPSAEDQYRTALRERPAYPFAMAGLASIEAKKGNYKEAEGLLDQAISIIPEFSFYIQLAEVYGATDRPGRAKKTTDDILAMMADDETHGHKMDLEYARVHLNLDHDYAAALERTMVEYDVRPANIDVNKTLAQIYYKSGQLAEAEQHLAVALRTNSQDCGLLMIGGLIQVKTGNVEQGEELIERSIGINPYQDDQFSNEGQELTAEL